MPDSLDELVGALSGDVTLPIRLLWSGPTPGAVHWDLAQAHRRRDLYEIILANGDLDDVRALVNPQALIEQWPDLYLPPWVRTAWQPLIDSARSAA